MHTRKMEFTSGNVIHCNPVIVFNINTRGKVLCKNLVEVGIGLKNVQKQGRDEHTRRLSCRRKVVVKKDSKTTLHLLPVYPSLCSFFWLLGSKLTKRYSSTSSGNFNNSIYR